MFKINNQRGGLMEFISTAEQIKLKVQLAKLSYLAGEQVNVTAVISNTGTELYSHRGSSTCDDSLYCSITGSNSTDSWPGEGNVERNICTDDLHEFHLTAGETIESNASFPVDHKKGSYLLKCRYGKISQTIPIIVE